jgi:hypothetical protein
MNARPITVADIIKYFQTFPPETKVRVMREINRNYSTYTEFTEIVQYGEGEFNVDYVDGIYYSKNNNSIDFGIN